MFKNIERVKEKENTQDRTTPQERKGVNATVLKAREILANLVRIKNAIQRKEKYTAVTAQDIAKLARGAKITTSEVKTARRITEEIKNPFKGKEADAK